VLGGGRGSVNGSPLRSASRSLPHDPPPPGQVAQCYWAQSNRAQAKEWIARSLAVPAAVGEDADDIAAQGDLARKLGVR